MKRFASILCCMLAVITGILLVCTPVRAAESDTCSENVTWTLSDGTLTISGSGAFECVCRLASGKRMKIPSA